MLPPPEVFEVRGGGAVPPLAILFIKGDLAQGRVDESGQVLRDEPQRLVEVDRARDRLAHVDHQLELLRVALRVLIQARRFHRDGQLAGRRAQGLDLPPVGPALVRAVVADLEDARRPA